MCAAQQNIAVIPTTPCGCESCDLCREVREVDVQCLTAQERAAERKRERQKAILVAAEAARFAEELPVY